MNNVEFLRYVKEQRVTGASESEIARGLGLSTIDYRKRLVEAKTQERNAFKDAILEAKRTGLSNKELAEKFNVKESYIRNIVKE